VKQTNYYDAKTNTSTLTYTYNNIKASLYYDMADVSKKIVSFWTGPFIKEAVNNSTFSGKFGNGKSVDLLYSDKRAYITKSDIMAYFVLLWCPGFGGGQPSGNGAGRTGEGLTETSNKSYTVSDKLVEFLKGYEGFSSTPYYATQDEKNNGILTIGYGHVIKVGETYTQITEAEASNLLKQDIGTHIPKVFFTELVNSGVYLKQCEADALVSLCFNWSAKVLTEKESPKFTTYLRSGKYTPEETEAHFITYDKQQGKSVPGLTIRRKAEAKMFSYGIYDSAH